MIGTGMSAPDNQQLDPRRHRMLHAMDIDVWLQRGAVAQPSSISDTLATGNSAALDWPELQTSVAACTACELHRSRSQTVFGVGSRQADCLVIGEAPGAEEDRRGEPFVGPAGQLLNAMLAAMGLSRDDVYIANILKCRPPGNRDPEHHEVSECSGYLARQIALVEPRIILALGRIAAQNLLHTATPIGQMRGQQYTYGDTEIPVIVTYHPAYLLRSPGEKRKSWDDLQLAMIYLAEVKA